MRANRESSTDRPAASRPWFRKAAALMCLSSVLLASGFHTVALQSYGWLRMYDVYSDTVPASEALELTFSRQELCGICVLSQELTQNLDDSLKLALDTHTPLPPPSSHSPFLTLPQATPVLDGVASQIILHEIVIEFEPPPPRCA